MVDVQSSVNVGGKYGIGIVGGTYEVRSADGGSVRFSVSVFGARARVTKELTGESWDIDLGAGGTVALGSGVSVFVGLRINEDGVGGVASGSYMVAPNAIGPVGAGGSLAVEASVGELPPVSVRVAGEDYSLFGAIHRGFVEFMTQSVGHNAVRLPSVAFAPKCFPVGTMVDMWPKGLIPDADGVFDGAEVRAGTWQEPIEEVTAGDQVVSFDKAGNLKPASVTRLFRNITDTWVELSREGETEPFLTATPGHRFLDEHGGFTEIGKMLERGGGKARVVLEDGSLAEVTGEIIRYSAETAHLYEEAEEVRTRTVGGLALQPEVVKGWRTYNFEVEHYHTYIAGGVRVHNISEPFAHNLRGVDDYGDVGVVYSNSNSGFFIDGQSLDRHYDNLGGADGYAGSALGWGTTAAFATYDSYAAMLLRAMKAWARAKGAEMLTIHGTSGQMARMARGARPIGVNVVVPLGA